MTRKIEQTWPLGEGKGEQIDSGTMQNNGK